MIIASTFRRNRMDDEKKIIRLTETVSASG